MLQCCSNLQARSGPLYVSFSSWRGVLTGHVKLSGGVEVTLAVFLILWNHLNDPTTKLGYHMNSRQTCPSGYSFCHFLMASVLLWIVVLFMMFIISMPRISESVMFLPPTGAILTGESIYRRYVTCTLTIKISSLQYWQLSAGPHCGQILE